MRRRTVLQDTKTFDFRLGRCRMIFFLLSLAFTACVVSAGPGVFSFASYYGDNMVLQRDPQKAVVWGFTEKTEENITGTLYTDPPSVVTVMSVPHPSIEGGVWRVAFDPVKESPKGSDGIKIEVSKLATGEKLTISNVLFGDVWICSGQSNMQFTLDMAFNATEELEDAMNYPDIRVFTASMETANSAQIDLISVEEKWSMPTKDSLGHSHWSYFSAVCWLYGKYLHQNLKIPIGLISSTWGGTAIELWSSPDSLKKCNVTEENVDEEFSHTDKLKFKRPSGHSVLWNAMMHPFTNLSIKGVIWYQGEANSGHPDSYVCTFPAMIDDWGKKFHESNDQNEEMMPFGFVQLAGNRNQTIKTGFPDIRWHQTADYGYVPNDRMRRAFMGVAMDLPDVKSPEGSVHPRDKQDVAWRLTVASLVVIYGANYVNFQGPRVTSLGVDMGLQAIKMDFDSSALDIRSEYGFEVCCGNTKQSKCNGTDSDWTVTPITQHDDSSVTISYKGACSNKQIVALRYAWRESPCDFKKCAVYESINDFPMAPYLHTDFGLNGRSQIPVNYYFNGKFIARVH